MITVNETIIKILKEIELNEDIEIIYACEAGSRAWGFCRKDSDYDIRFIYMKRNVEDYLSLKSISDVIEYEGDDMDIVGWDIKKAFTLHYKDNPSLREWLMSDIVYIDRGISKIFTLNDFDKAVLMNHYSAIAKSHWKRYSGLEFSKKKIKKYLYVLRSILCWKLLERDIYPPLKIQELLDHDKINISDEIRRDICSLIDYYLDISDIGEDAIFRINNFILRSLDSMKKVKAETSKDFSEYDKRFREFLLSAGDCDDGEF